MGESGSKWTGWQVGRRLLGGGLVVLGLLPGSLLLDPSTVGPFGEWVLALEAGSGELVFWGSLIVLAGGFLGAGLVGDRALRAGLRRLGRALGSASPAAFALALGAFSTLLAAAVGRILSGGLPTYVDSMAQLLQARFLAEGMMAGPVPEPRASQAILNTLMTEAGWVSLYPPGHTFLLAGGLVAGAVTWVGPILTGLTVAASARLMMEILSDPPWIGRTAAVLTALSPFVLFIGGGFLSHTSCAAGVALAAWFGYRAQQGHWIWTVATGGAMGLAVASRPWTGLAILGVVVPILWLKRIGRKQRPGRWLLVRALGAGLGGAPFALLLLGYNAHHFGSPFTLGYGAAYGPAHGLGFHQDPWGYPYGLTEALGFTASDLSALGMHLLEIPLPLVALVGTFLVAARRVPRGTGVLLAWSLAPVAANFFYWHHGFHLGPRMLYEAAPAWAGLVALTAAWLAAPTVFWKNPPTEGERSASRKNEGRVRLFSGVRPGSIFLWAMVLTLAGPMFMIPARLGANSWSDATRARMSPPRPEPESALVFVHGSWSERVSARLQASGMRFDSLELALRRNDLCLVDRYARARLAGEPVPELDFTARPGAPPGLRDVETPGGGRIRADPTTTLTESCARELRADRFGTTSLAPLLWQGDLRGATDGAPVFVRDLGPEGNGAVLAEWPDRTPYLWLPERPDAPPTLQPYAPGMRKVWR